MAERQDIVVYRLAGALHCLHGDVCEGVSIPDNAAFVSIIFDTAAQNNDIGAVHVGQADGS